jgi:16S rRNA processing protein RimM
VVKPCDGSRDDRERLIPWLRESVISNIDLREGRIEVDWDPEF